MEIRNKADLDRVNELISYYDKILMEGNFPPPHINPILHSIFRSSLRGMIEDLMQKVNKYGDKT